MFKSQYIKRMLDAGNELEALKHAETLACMMNSGMYRKRNKKPFKPSDFYPDPEISADELERLWWSISR